MYYRIQVCSPMALFHTHEQAKKQLLSAYLAVTQGKAILLDYLLLSHSLALIIKTDKNKLLPKQERVIQLVPLNDKTLLLNFAHLGILGSSYPYSGTFELFHKSICYCELGKTGAPNLPFSLSTIIKAKQEAHRLALNPIFSNEIA